MRRGSVAIFASELRPGDAVSRVGERTPKFYVSKAPGALRRFTAAKHELLVDGFIFAVPMVELVGVTDTLGHMHTFLNMDELRRFDPLPAAGQS